MARVSLLYFEGCPHIDAAREQLRRAFAATKEEPIWLEIDVRAASAPANCRGWGSPTVLVDGRDVTGASPADDAACRYYPNSDLAGAPPLEAIVAALRAGRPR